MGRHQLAYKKIFMDVDVATFFSSSVMNCLLTIIFPRPHYCCWLELNGLTSAQAREK